VSRVARIVVPGVPHHITQRGNNRQPVFSTDRDRLDYLSILSGQSRKHSLDVLAYCLMDNHVHLVAVPGRPDSLARAVGMTHLVYARSFNERNDRSGHLWQGRFFSCPLDPARTLLAIRYVEHNPVRAGIVGSAGRYSWSSAGAHLDGHDAHAVLALNQWLELTEGIRWSEFLSENGDARGLAEMRSSTLIGRPWGSPGFTDKVERALGRRVRPRSVGRPRSAGRK